MNKTILQGRWRQLRGTLKSEWGRLTDNDRRQIDGKIDQVVGLVQTRYGYTQQAAADTLAHYLGDYGKGRHNPPARAVAWRFPLLTLMGMTGVAVLGWFFASRFFVEPTPPEEEPESIADFMSMAELEHM